MKVGYLPLINKGGGVFGDVFDWKSTFTIFEKTINLIKKNKYEISCPKEPISSPEQFQKIESKFIQEGIDVLFIHILNIMGGESIYRLIKKLNVPVIISSVPEPKSLHEKPYTKRYASFCGGQWNMNMCYLMGTKARFIFGLPEERQYEQNLRKILESLNTLQKLKEWKICIVGDKTPGYYGAIYSEDLLMRVFNSTVTYMDFGMLNYLAQEVTDEDVKRKKNELFNSENIDSNLKSEHINNTIKVYVALEKYAIENEINSFTLKCVPETILLLGVAPCGINSLLSEKGLISGCEGDVLATLSMEIASKLSGTIPMMTDIMSVREPNNGILFWHCGAGAPSIAGKNKIKYRPSPILNSSDGNPQGVCVDFIPDYEKVNVSQLTEDWKTGNYRYLTADGNALETKDFIGGNSLEVELQNKEKFIETIIKYSLPHHFQVTGVHLSETIEELCFWKDIELLKI